MSEIDAGMIAAAEQDLMSIRTNLTNIFINAHGMLVLANGDYDEAVIVSDIMNLINRNFSDMQKSAYLAVAIVQIAKLGRTPSNARCYCKDDN